MPETARLKNWSPGAYTVVLQRCGWRHSVKATPQPEAKQFLARRERCLRKSSKRAAWVKSGICQGITWGLNE